MSASIKVAAVQMVSTTSVSVNLETAGRLIASAADQGAELVALPEYFCVMGYHETDKVALREIDGEGPIQNFLRESAARHKIVLVGGTLPLVSPDLDKVLNTTLVFGADGEALARYDKIHLFGFHKGTESYDEARTITPGRIPATFIAPLRHGGLQSGLTICYDLRFPELFRQLSDGGKTGLMIVPSAFTYTTGSAHWEILLRARAIENQCYVLAAAQGGKHENGRRTWGHSMLIDPWGKVQAVLPEGEGIVIGTIDPSFMQDVRQNLPALKHRVM